MTKRNVAWQVRLLQPTFQQESSVENRAKLHKVIFARNLNVVS
jgi:hypothetical protein